MIGGSTMTHRAGSMLPLAGLQRADGGLEARFHVTADPEFRGKISRRAAEPPSRRAAEPPSRRAAEPPSRRAAEPPSRPPASSWWRHRLGHSASRPDSLSSSGVCAATRRPASSSDPFVAFAAFAGRLRRSTAAALLALPLLAPAAGAQAQVLASNIGQADGGTVTFQRDHALILILGNNTDGYRLESVDIEFASATSSSAFDSNVLAVEIRRNNGRSKPGELVGRLTNPAGTSFSDDRLIRFTAPGGGIDLEPYSPGREYFLVLDVAGQHDADFAKIRITTSTADDAGGAADFNIGASTMWRKAGDNSSANWRFVQPRGQPLKIRLNGTVRETPFLPFGSEHMPQIVLSQDNFKLAEPQDNDCSDDKVGTEKTPVYNQNTRKLEEVQRNYGDVLTSVQYKVQLDRTPGPDKYVSVEVWDPTDLDQPDVRDGFRPDGSRVLTGHFSQNAQIHGISWRGGQEGRISIAKSFLTFTDKNWNRAQTVTVNIHCAQHDVNNPLPIWHFAFRHDDRVINPGATHQYRLSDSVHAAGDNRKGDNSPDNTSLRIAQVRVSDSTEPAAVTSNVDGKLVLDAYGSGFTTGGKKMISLEFAWNHPDNSLHNDHDDAAEQFAAFRVRLRTVEPAGHEVQEKVVPVDAISPHEPEKTTISWYAALEAKGHVGWVHGRPEPTDSKYEWSVVPLDRRWNVVESERVTKCVVLTSRAGSNGGRASRIDEAANPDCPPAPQNAPAQAAPAPTETVSNLQLAAVDAASASVSWDAVAHATSYDVSWEAESSDLQTVISGVESVTGTTATIQHNAQEAMTLTVTVTPEHLDGNGVVQQLDALAATATLAVGPGGDALRASAGSTDSPAPACVSDALLAEVRTAAGETWRSPGHVERWSRVLAAFGVDNAWSNNPMTVAEAQAQADRGLKRWAPVAPALECLAAVPEEQPEQAEAQPVTLATPELSLSAGSAVDEGGNATFTVTADPAPATDLTVTWTVAQSGEYLDAPGAGSRTATLTAGATSIALSVATVDDATDETDGSVSVTLGTGTGYTIATGKGSAAVTVRDNDEPVVSIAAGNGVTEGAAASFTVSATPVPAAPLDVTLTVGQSGEFAASGETGSRTVTVPVTGSATFEVATVDDGADEPDGSITATLGTGTGYTVAAAPDHAATVAVSDNDAASSGPTLSIADATFNENAGRVHFTVTLSEPADRTVTVRFATRDSSPVSAVAGQDYLAWQRSWQVWARFTPGETETQIFAYIYNDSHDEDPETFEMVLFDASDGVSIADGVAVGTITNDDPMPAAWLARFGRTAAEQALDGIAGRIAAPRDAGVQGTIAGQALNFDPGAQSGAANDHAAPGNLAGNDLLAQSDVARAFGAGHGGFGSSGPDGFGSLGFDSSGTGAQSYSMTGLEVLLGSSFTATGGKDGTGGSLAFWGRAAQSSFDGREGTFSLDGEATTATLGADYARGNWLVGLALLQSDGEGGYADTDARPRPASQTCPDDLAPLARDILCGGAVREGDGKVEASLTAAVPYGAIQASERLRLWGALGTGTGEVTLKPEVGGLLSSDISWTMAAAGLRGDVIAPPAGGSGPALSVTSDALWARTSSDKTHELAASESDVTRLRLGLEGSWRIATAGGGHVMPKLELGMRHDGGDAETGFGVELGGGLAWIDPTLGLALDLSGRTLIAHGSDDLEDQGFAASLAWDPGPSTGRGPSLTLRQDWGGAAQGGLDALFAPDPLADRAGSGQTTARWTAEAAWGFPAFSGRFTGSPHAGMGLATGARDYTLGWRVAPAAGANAPDLSFGVRATRRESDALAPEHAAGFEVIGRW